MLVGSQTIDTLVFAPRTGSYSCRSQHSRAAGFAEHSPVLV